MDRRVIRRPQAIEDLIESFVYIDLDNPVVAERFLDAAEQTIQEIAAMPLLGGLQHFGARRLEGLRSRHIKGFSNWLVYYTVSDEAVEIVRVLHGARDLEQIFADEE